MTAIYNLKILKMSRSIAKRQFFDHKKVYSLPEASHLYDKLLTELNRNGFNLEDNPEFIDIEISHIDPEIAESYILDDVQIINDSLQNIISMYIQKKINDEKDSKKIARYEEIEDSIMSSWWEEMDVEDSTSEVNTSSEKRIGWFKKKQNKHLENSEEYESSSSYQAEYDADEDIFDQPVDSEMEEDDQLDESSIIDEKASDSVDSNEYNGVENSSIKDSTSTDVGRNSFDLTDKSQYITIDHDNEIEKSSSYLLNEIKEVQKEGAQYIIDRLEYASTDNDFIRLEKEKYIRQNYSEESVELLKTKYIQEGSNLLNYASDSLNYRYDEVMAFNKDEELNKDLTDLEANINKQYSQEVDSMIESETQIQQSGFEALIAKHEQELIELKAKQEKEKEEFESNARSEISCKKENIKSKWLEEKDKQESAIKAKYAEEEKRHKLNELKISRENILKQCVEKYYSLHLQFKKDVIQIVSQWNKRIKDNEPAFQKAYEENQQQKHEQEQLEEKQRKAENEERELALKEKQLEIEAQKHTDLVEENAKLHASIENLQNELHAQNRNYDEHLREFQNRYADDMLQMKYQRNDELSDKIMKQQKADNSKKLWHIALPLACLLIPTAIYGYNEHQEDLAQKAKEEHQLEIKESKEKKSQSKQLQDLMNQVSTLQSENRTVKTERDNAIKQQQELESKNKDENPNKQADQNVNTSDDGGE